MPSSNIRYRMRSLDSLLVAREIFAEGAYQGILPLENITHFADVGCNCGFFTCFLMDALGRKDLFALMLDANPRMVKEANWHIEANGFANVYAVWGVAGAPGGTSLFYLHPDDAGSSHFAELPAGHVTRNQWRRIEAPSLSLETEWRSQFGDQPCDLLKVDIEGSEALFVENEAKFLASVGMVVIEVHHWLVDLAKLERDLDRLSFSLVKVLSTDDKTDVRFYRHQNRDLVKETIPDVVQFKAGGHINGGSHPSGSSTTIVTA